MIDLYKVRPCMHGSVGYLVELGDTVRVTLAVFSSIVLIGT